MNPADPATLEEYNARFMASQEITGHGILETTMHMPCPFCCAPDWWVYAIIDMARSMAEDMPKKCESCGRSGRMIRRDEGGGVVIEFVQTGGDDPAPYLPTMRRESG